MRNKRQISNLGGFSWVIHGKSSATYLYLSMDRTIGLLAVKRPALEALIYILIKMELGLNNKGFSIR
jgi:hypothetical protein